MNITKTAYRVSEINGAACIVEHRLTFTKAMIIDKADRSQYRREYFPDADQAGRLPNDMGHTLVQAWIIFRDGQAARVAKREQELATARSFVDHANDQIDAAYQALKSAGAPEWSDAMTAAGIAAAAFEQTATVRDLTTEERDALAAYALMHGRCWKQALREAWMGPASEPGILQALRNDVAFGPHGLNVYRLEGGR